jgi:hypothetical protein
MLRVLSARTGIRQDRKTARQQQWEAAHPDLASLAEQVQRLAEYEIDLSTKNAAAFRKKLAPFIEHARKAGRRP